MVLSRRTKAKAAGKVARGTGKALKTGAQSRTARKAARGAGKVALKGGAQALSPGESRTSRFLKYGIFTAAGFVIGAILARSREKEVGTASSFSDSIGQHIPDPGSPAGERGQTWGSGTSLGTAGGASDPARPQRPEDPNRTGSEREYSDPSAGPLIGRQHHAGPPEVAEQQEEVEQRIRTRIGDDPRTAAMPRVNVEVNDGVAELRGVAPSEEAQRAAGQIATETEGVREVRNLITVDPQGPTRTGNQGS